MSLQLGETKEKMMPTPVEILMDPISLVILAMYVLLVVWEAVFPARVLPEIP